MMQRVRLNVDSSIPKEYENAANPITIQLKDGRTLNDRVDTPHGDWDDRLTQEEILAKYQDNAKRVLTPDNCLRSAELVLGLERLDTITELAQIYTLTETPN